MPLQDAEAFLRYARRNRQLQRQLNPLKGANALQELTAIAAEAGFRFSEAAYRKAVVSESAGELEPEALDALAREMGLGGRAG